jgi:hypothetical protein
VRVTAQCVCALLTSGSTTAHATDISTGRMKASAMTTETKLLQFVHTAR